MNVVVLGASNNPTKYSYMAVERLMNAGHRVFPVHKAVQEILGLKVYEKISDIKEPIDTLTMYVNSTVSSSLEKEIMELNPKRIIFNPGSENTEIADKAKEQGIEVLYACTLVLLSINKF